MLPDCCYEYRYERNGGALRCDYCDDEISDGEYYFDINNRTYCYDCIEDSKCVAEVD